MIVSLFAVLVILAVGGRATDALRLSQAESILARLSEADARAYYTVVTSGGGTACINGACLFVFGSSGIFQGDVTAALMFKF